MPMRNAGMVAASFVPFSSYRVSLRMIASLAIGSTRLARPTLSACLALALAVVPGVAFAQATPPARAQADARAFDIAAFDARVEAMMREWNQPGLAIAIVRDGRIIHERGFGVRKAGETRPVDARTLFGIASLTKSFASATVAKLVDEGKLAWDAPVTRYLPWFRMPRDRDTDEVTLRDLLSMRSGIGSSEYTFRRASLDRADHVRRIRFLPQVHPLRSEFLYTTDSYTALGQVVSTVTGKAWEDYAAESFWKPLGMTRTNADSLIARADANAASPHLRQADTWRSIAAGGINTSAHDMALWLQFQLSDGRSGAKALLSPAALHETHSPQTPVRGVGSADEWVAVAGDGEDRIRFRSYAMGWYTHDYRGHTVISHSGGIDGFRSRMAFLPDDGIAVVALANSEETSMPLAVAQMAIDEALGVGDRDWSRRFRARALKQRADSDASQQTVVAARVTGTSPSMTLNAYTGSFADNGAFGTAKVTMENGHLVIAAGRDRYDLEHWNYDVFKARPRWPYEMDSRNFFVEFRRDPKGRMDRFDFSTGYAFKRVTDAP
jgi:CubicO group peptidase (beta-lactamase class C family)